MSTDYFCIQQNNHNSFVAHALSAWTPHIINISHNPALVAASSDEYISSHVHTVLLFVFLLWLCSQCIGRSHHYNDVIMTVMASEITSLMVVYSTVYSGTDQRKHQSSASLSFVFPATGEFPAQKAGNVENVSIWWRHHDISSHRSSNPTGIILDI